MILNPTQWLEKQSFPLAPPTPPTISESGALVTVAELDTLTQYLFDMRDYVESIEAYVSELNKATARVKMAAVRYLKELNREDYPAERGTIRIREQWGVKLPDSEEKKALFLNHLKERGIYERYVTVNAASLKALYNSDWEAAKKRGEGMEFEMPGIEPPTLYEDLGMVAARKKRTE